MKATPSSSIERFSCVRPWGSCRFRSCRLPPPEIPSPHRSPAAMIRVDHPMKAACTGASPVMPYPSKRLSSSAAVPPSPAGVTLSSLQSAALIAWVRTTFSISLASADLKVLLRCRVRGASDRCYQRPWPRASLGLFLKRAGGVLPRCRGGDAAHQRDRAGDPRRARVHAAHRPIFSFGLDPAHPSPDPSDRAMRWTDLRDLTPALRRSRASDVPGHAASPRCRPGQPNHPKMSRCPEAIQTAFSFLDRRSAIPAWRRPAGHAAARRVALKPVRGVHRSDAATARPATSYLGLPRSSP